MPIVHPPSFDEQILRALAYLCTAAIGGSVIVTNLYGTLIERQLGGISIVWVLFMLTAVPAAYSTLIGNYRIEYALLPCFSLALLAANVLTWTALIVGDDWTSMPRAFASSALVFMLAWRWRSLHRLIRVLRWTRPLHRR